MKSNQVQQSIIGFVHIEKAAGTTLIHILRSNFFLRYCDIRPLSAGTNGAFCANDLRRVLAINPFIRCVAGHALRPFGHFDSGCPRLLFITLLRDPIQRYISQYQYLTEEMNEKYSFEGFLATEKFNNFQTKKIAGCEDVELAKNRLEGQFLLVGVVEEFDEFLVLLKKKLAPMEFDPRYTRVNAARDKGLSARIAEKYYQSIVERNRADIELYRYVKECLIPRDRAWYGESLKGEVDKLRKAQTIAPMMRLKSQVDFVVRKAYIEPVTGVMRKLAGLPARGSY